jgi:ATP phosphoribosyltransferase
MTDARTTTRSRVAVPSKGRLREECLRVLGTAGYSTSGLHGGGAIAAADGIEFLEMRPRDAAAALSAGQLSGAFLSTDIVMEHQLEELPQTGLGFSRSDLVLASRDDDGRTSAADLQGGVVATHLPGIAERFFADKAIDVTVVAMGGSLEGVCASGIADAIIDLRQTGTSLRNNRLRVLEEIRSCQALFVRHRGTVGLDDLTLRMEAVLSARRHRYVMLHVPSAKLDELRSLLPGLASPTVLPLAGRQDLVAVHMVVLAEELWQRLGDLRAVGATGIVAMEPQALLH